MALFGKTLGMFRGEGMLCTATYEANTAPQDSRLRAERDTRAGTQWKIIKCSCQPPPAPPTVTFDIRTGKDARHNLLVIHMDASLPPSILLSISIEVRHAHSDSFSDKFVTKKLELITVRAQSWFHELV